MRPRARLIFLWPRAMRAMSAKASCSSSPTRSTGRRTPPSASQSTTDPCRRSPGPRTFSPTARMPCSRAARTMNVSSTRSATARRRMKPSRRRIAQSAGASCSLVCSPTRWSRAAVWPRTIPARSGFSCARRCSTRSWFEACSPPGCSASTSRTSMSRSTMSAAASASRPMSTPNICWRCGRRAVWAARCDGRASARKGI